MMRKYLKDSLHWIHLALFKPITLEAQVRKRGIWRVPWIYLKVLPVHLAIIMSVIAFVGILSELAGYRFNWSLALVGLLLAELVGGLVISGVVGGLAIGLFEGLTAGLVGGLAFALEVGLVSGVGIGLVAGLGEVLVAGLGVNLFGGLAAGLFFGQMARFSIVFGGGLGGIFLLTIAVSIVPDKGLAGALLFATAYAAVFLFVYLRPFHLVAHSLQLWRSNKAADPFPFFRDSPVYWDETVAMPLPFLTLWLVRLASFDRKRGMHEIVNVMRLPHQRGAAHRALVTILLQDLAQADSLKNMAAASSLLGILPADHRLQPVGLGDAVRLTVRVGELAKDYVTRVTTVGQMSILRELRNVVESFRNTMIFVEPPVGLAFESAASRWLEIVKREELQVRKRIAFEAIPNPFVVGNPLVGRDHNLFKGRKDIIVAIEENIINPSQRPALLLYGRRRIGKTSTLLNLPRLLSSKFVPVFIDCQDAKWREGDVAFCYHLAASIHDALNQRALVETSPRPQLERFEQYTYTRFGEYLDQIEDTSRNAHKQILLTLDEYEKLEEGMSGSKVTTEVLNQLRNIVQHRERIVVLFSGGHRFEEMRTINWSDYLINVKTLELSYLAHADARELITEPVPLLQYEPGVIEQIIELTHCQPYLLQAVASDLVNYLNSQKRMLATAADLKVAGEKVLVTAHSYFFYTWSGDCTEPEREVLRLIATGNMNSRTLAEHQSSLQSLCHKEILERHASGYRFSIELFRRWVLKNQTAESLPHGDLPEPAELEYADLQTTHT